MAGKDVRGRFVWYDLMTTDPEAAKKFYTDLIGWDTQQWEQDASYTMWTNEGQPLGGLMTLPDEAKKVGAPPHWIAYVACPDCKATAKQAEELGGKVLKAPTEIPNTGTFAVIQDPQGAVFAVYSSASEPGEEHPPHKGEFSWHELATTDHEAAFNFYHSLFGWQKTEAMDMGEAGTYQMYGRTKEMPLGGMYNKPADMPAPPHWLLYTKVDSVDDAVARVKKMGGQVLNGPMEVPGGDKVAQCMDPQGVAFAIHSSAN